MSQSGFEELIAKQKARAGKGNVHDYDGANADLSEVRVLEKGISGTSIAVSRLMSVRFDASFDLHGVAWIGDMSEVYQLTMGGALSVIGTSDHVKDVVIHGSVHA